MESLTEIYPDPVLSAIPATKLHRANLSKQVPRQLILTTGLVYSVDPKTFALKDQVAIKDIVGISTSTMADGLMIIHCPGAAKGDLILSSPEYCVEFLSRLYLACKDSGKSPKVVVDARLNAAFGGGQKTVLTFQTDERVPRMGMKKSKDGWNVIIPSATH